MCLLVPVNFKLHEAQVAVFVVVKAVGFICFSSTSHTCWEISGLQYGVFFSFSLSHSSSSSIWETAPSLISDSLHNIWHMLFADQWAGNETVCTGMAAPFGKYFGSKPSRMKVVTTEASIVQWVSLMNGTAHLVLPQIDWNRVIRVISDPLTGRDG